MPSLAGSLPSRASVSLSVKRGVVFLRAGNEDHRKQRAKCWAQSREALGQ